jgi:[FeFe] hydrogenase H-cluster maturation GTPase HydF
MSLNDTPSSERVHIGFFGRRNAGKSSLVNAVTGQELSVVSATRGTTTDPVQKAMELLPLGPVVIIDTPGIDDEGQLGELRVRKAKQVLNRIDLAVLAVDGMTGKNSVDEELIAVFRKKGIPYLVVYTKEDLRKEREELPVPGNREVYVSARTGRGIRELKECLARLAVREEPEKRLVADLLSPSDLAVLVVPVDKAAPKGRLILPQQQTIRDILEADAAAVVVKENGLKHTLENLKQKPKLVITDSQVFDRAAAETPEEIWLTSFSVLFARYKGNLRQAVTGAAALNGLKDGDQVLISEGCTHHRQCGDIGTEKLPAWIRKFTGSEPEFSFTSGLEFPEDLERYSLIIHCGGCMLNEREMKYRLKCAEDQGIPMTNYGTAIAHMRGILKRSIAMFPEMRE